MKAEPPQCWRHLLLRSKRILKAHPLICLSVGLTLLFATVTARVRAQQSAATSAADTLQAAIALYEQGEARLAQPMFGAIAPSSPAYGAALAYDSLCRYEICRADVTNGYSWFLDGLKAPALQQATLPAELQEELAFKQIDALYVSRQFGSPESLSLITEFRTTYPASARLPALTEYELAAWFERGMQRLYGASLDETKRFHKTWTNGVAYLEQFLSLTKALPAEDYTVLKDRSLNEDLLVALTLLGKSPGTLAEVPVRDAVSRQRYGLICVALHQKMHPEEWEQNLQLLADASADLQKFPASRDSARMKRQLARFAFRTGERFCAEAAGIPPTDPQPIAAKRALGSRYFQSARAVQGQMAKLDWSSTSHTDAGLMWMDYFNSYFCDRDYDALLAATAAQLTNSAPGNPKWLAAKLYHGVALNHQTPPEPAAAAAAFEEVLSYGLRASEKRQTHDHLVLFAARWRIHLAFDADDPATAVKIVQWVEQADGDADLKAKFLKDHQWVTRWAAANGS